jgi:cation diffusion facilitator family transporter
VEEKNKVSSIIIVSTVGIIFILFAAWWISNSVVIQAELYDSVVDLLYSIIIVSGFLLSRRNRKPKYPEGLIRLEPIVASFVGFIVIGSGSYIIYNSISRIQSAGNTDFSSIALLLLLLSTIVKLILFMYVRKKSEDLNSSSLYATSVDLRNDVLTHIASLVGFLSVLTTYYFIEPLIATIIATYILFTGLKLIQENIPNLLGLSVDEREKEKLRETALSHEKVYGIHELEVHFTGDLIDISLHIEIDGNISVNEGHEIEVKVADMLRENSNYRVNEINIHLDPYDLDEWKNAERG